MADHYVRHAPDRFDVIKSRIQNTPKMPGVAPKYNSTYPACVSRYDTLPRQTLGH